MLISHEALAGGEDAPVTSQETCSGAGECACVWNQWTNLPDPRWKARDF